MYRADVTRLEELNRQLDELRDQATQQAHRIDALASELRSYRAIEGRTRRSAAAGVVIGFAPFMVIATGLVICGRGALAADESHPLTCVARLAEASGDAAHRATASTSFTLADLRRTEAWAQIGGLDRDPTTRGYEDETSDEPGFLTLVCNPMCDDVLEDGRSLGGSPIVHMAVKPGRHVLTLVRKTGAPRGRFTKAVVVSVAPGQVTATRVSMKTELE